MEIVSELNKKGYLVSDDFIEGVPEDFDINNFINLLEEKIKNDNNLVVLNKDLLKAILLNNNNLELNWIEFDHSKSLLEKEKDGELYNTFRDILHYSLDEENKLKMDKILKSIEENENEIGEYTFNDNESSVVILNSYKEDAKKRNVEDFVFYLRRRFEALSNILRTRQELSEIISLNRLKGKRDGERVSLIGMIVEKRQTKNDNIMIKIEDFTGEVLIIVNKNRKEVYENARDLCNDGVIGVIGSKSGNFIFVDDILFPDVPLIKGLKKYDEEVYCAFTSDLHVGNKEFIKENFEYFLKWLDGEYGNDEQKRIASKLRYLIISGDLVDGVGIYPGQESDCYINDIYKQYEELTYYLKKIPKHIQVIISPGNHDALRLTEPQPAIGKEYCEELLHLENIYLVSNPSFINVHANENFDGFDVLIYHGASFNYYIDNVESIRLGGGYERADLVMQYLMKMRHLAPSHTSTSYVPTTNADHLVIDKVPDFFVTGHIHRVSVSNYRNISLINSGCWIEQTDFQEKVGLVPEPGKIVVVNLATRDMKILSFYENGNK